MTSSQKIDPDRLAQQDGVMPPAPASGDLWALVADVGGTHARFGMVDTLGGVAWVRSLPVAEHAGMVEATVAYLALLQSSASLENLNLKPTHAAIAVASPIAGDEVRLTNGPWSFSRRAVKQALGLDSLLVLNDFEALALGLPCLGPHQFRPWAAAPKAEGVLAVVGPGTGLGVAGVVQTPLGWQALAAEGGHATLAAGDDFEDALLKVARRDFAHVSAERFLSGTGLPVLHQAVATTLGLAAPKLSAERIIELGLAKQDSACDKTIDLFCAWLGSFAGNVALTLGARGGVYIGGGIVPRLGERFFQSAFRQRFDAKGRYSGYLASVPTALITDTMAALSGAALAVRQHGPRDADD